MEDRRLRHEDGNVAAQKVSRQRRSLVITTFGPAEFDRDVATFDMTAFH